MSARARSGDELALEPDLAEGFLAALPLLLAYELGRGLARGSPRAPAEAALTRILELLPGGVERLRPALLAALALWAGVRLARRPRGTRLRALARRVGEGLLAGVLLGPVLVGLQSWLAGRALAFVPAVPRGLSSTLRLLGSAPWEELLFRVGLYAALYLLARRTSAFLGLAAGLSAHVAELAALLVSALAFAAFHLDPVQRLLGSLGEPYDPGLFLWRVSAGLLLGLLYRWRGLGVAAWSHAIYNLGLALGIPAWPS